MARAGKAKNIAKERIEELFELAVRTGDAEQSRNAIRILRDLATKHNMVITEKKKQFCLACNTIFVPGKTCTVRVHDNRRVYSCSCGAVRRFGY